MPRLNLSSPESLKVRLKALLRHDKPTTGEVSQQIWSGESVEPPATAERRPQSQDLQPEGPLNAECALPIDGTLSREDVGTQAGEENSAANKRQQPAATKEPFTIASRDLTQVTSAAEADSVEPSSSNIMTVQQGEAKQEQATKLEESQPETSRCQNKESRPKDESPIFSESVARFAESKPELYRHIKDRIVEIKDLDVGDWDTWLIDQSDKTTHTWFRRCKTYLPAFKSIKSVAMSVSRLDPYNIAPLITSGVFAAVEVIVFLCALF
jgi:hypothetical protein